MHQTSPFFSLSLCPSLRWILTPFSFSHSRGIQSSKHLFVFVNLLSFSLSHILDESSYTPLSLRTRSLDLSLSPSLSLAHSCRILIYLFLSLPPMHIQINNKNGRHTLCRRAESHLKESSLKTTHYHLHVAYGIPTHHHSPQAWDLTKHLKTSTSQNLRRPKPHKTTQNKTNAPIDKRL